MKKETPWITYNLARIARIEAEVIEKKAYIAWLKSQNKVYEKR